MFSCIARAFVITFMGVSLSFQATAQTIVSTSPSTKRAVLEEFGGIYCVYCPQGHDIIEEMEAGLAENLILINYQTGPYATPIGNDPDLGNDYSVALATASQLTGYPAATINRQVFPGLEQGVPGATAVGRGNWEEAVVEVLGQPAPVNLAAAATLNISSRELELYIEYYYTEDVALSDNRLHVAILQNNVIAPQHGGNAGNYYLHKRLFREFLTGQEGHIITNTENGSFGSITYNLQLPNYYRDIWMDPVNIEIAVFITENEHEVLNGVEVHPALESNFPADVRLLSIVAPDDTCDPQLDAEISFRNDGNEPLTACTVHYGMEGGPAYSLDWSGYLNPLETVTLPLNPVETLGEFSENTFYVNLEQPNFTSDPTADNNSRDHLLSLAPQVSSPAFDLAIRTDLFGYELYWEVIDEFGEIHAAGGNQVVGETNGGAQIAGPSNPGAYDDSDFIIEAFTLPQDGCYTLRVLDDYGDGLCCSYGNGFYRLRQNGETILEGGEFGALEEKHFTVGFITATAANLADDTRPRLFPNPASDGRALRLQWTATPPDNFVWQLFSTGGGLIGTGDHTLLPRPADYPRGYYVFQVRTREQVYTLPLLIQ